MRKVSDGKLLATYNRVMYFCIYNYGILWLIRGTVFPYFNISEISVHLYIGSSLNYCSPGGTLDVVVMSVFSIMCILGTTIIAKSCDLALET